MSRRLNERGHEVLSDKSVEAPLSWRKPPSLEDTVRNMLRQQLSQIGVSKGHETFEEADDFDIEGEPELTSAYEENFDHEKNLIADVEAHYKKRRKSNVAASAKPEKPTDPVA